MRRYSLLILVLLIQIFTYEKLFAYGTYETISPSFLYGEFSVGLDLPGELKFSDDKDIYLEKFKVQNPGISLSAQAMMRIVKFLDLGVGIAYVFPRNLESRINYAQYYDNATSIPDFKYLPIFASAKLYPLHGQVENIYPGLFLNFKCGYNYIFDYETYSNCKGYNDWSKPSFYSLAFGFDMFGSQNYGGGIDVEYSIYNSSAQVQNSVIETYNLVYTKTTINFKIIF